MEYFLIAGWIALFFFVAWEFVIADKLPQKYARLNPRTIRLVDLAIGLLAIASIWYFLQN